MSEELKPCPFCGQREAFVEQLDSDASVVICQGMVDEHSACLARGPVGLQQSDMEDQPGRGAAIAEWNRRAQPAEAEGFGRDTIVCWNCKQNVTLESRDDEDGFCPHCMCELDLSDYLINANAALSAVTAERDQLHAKVDQLMRESEDSAERAKHYAGRLGGALAEVEALRALLGKSLPVVEAHAEASHMLEGFRPTRNKWDELADGIRVALAAKEA